MHHITYCPSSQTGFIINQLKCLFDRYEIDYSREDRCIEYYIFTKLSHRPVSSDLVLSLNTFAKQIHVTRFYPELYKEKNSKYLSAACFYLLVHHFAQRMELDNGYRIYLETSRETFDNFYLKLRNFHLEIKKPGLGSNTVDVWSDYCPSVRNKFV